VTFVGLALNSLVRGHFFFFKVAQTVQAVGRDDLLENIQDV